MNFKTFTLTVFLCISSFAFSQEFNNRFDFRLGTGISLQGTGDMNMINYENELNYNLNNYFTLGAGLNFGRSFSGVIENATSTQGNLIFFYSPFRNNRRFDFRIGAGLGYQKYNGIFLQFARWQNGDLVETNFQGFENKDFGFNVTLEGSYMINDLYLIGAKIYTKPYSKGDIDSGIMLKFGRVF